MFIESKHNPRVIKGSKYIDVTLNKKIMHYLVEGLSKYKEFIESDEKENLNNIINEITKINDEMNEL